MGGGFKKVGVGVGGPCNVFWSGDCIVTVLYGFGLWDLMLTPAQ